jgi:hypothetical protein
VTEKKITTKNTKIETEIVIIAMIRKKTEINIVTMTKTINEVTKNITGRKNITIVTGIRRKNITIVTGIRKKIIVAREIKKEITVVREKRNELKEEKKKEQGSWHVNQIQQKMKSRK